RGGRPARARSPRRGLTPSPMPAPSNRSRISTKARGTSRRGRGLPSRRRCRGAPPGGGRRFPRGGAGGRGGPPSPSGGAGDLPPGELHDALALREGEPFSYLLAEEGRAALTQIFTRRGHLYARVEDEETFDETAEPGQEFARVQVRYRIQPGPVVRVRFVEVVGQRKTQESLVLDLINLKQGDVLTPEVLDRG